MKKQWLFLLAFCCVVSTAIAAPDIIYVTKAKPVFSIELPANATTGYSWVLGKHDSLIQLVTYAYYPSTNKKLMGAPGHALFQFKVVSRAFMMAKQAMVLEVLYQRPWNHQIGQQRIFSVQITS